MQKRLHEVFMHIRKHYDIHTQDDFAKYIGYGRTSISAAMNGNERYLSANLFRTICEKFPGIFNIDYLLTGEGQLLTTEEYVAKVASDDRNFTIKPPVPAQSVEIPVEIQTLIDRALVVSRRNDEMVERLLKAVSQNRDVEISLENASKQMREAQKHNDAVRCDILTAVESINKFRMTVDSIRNEHEAMNRRLDKAAELFKRLNSQMELMLSHPNAKYDVQDPEIHSANEP